MTKISIRFPLVRDEDIFNDREVLAVWDEEQAKLKRKNNEVVGATTQLKLPAPATSKTPIHAFSIHTTQ